MDEHEICAREVREGLRQKAIERALDEIAIEKGRKAEERFFEAMAMAPKDKMPNWLVSVEKASLERDRRGVDAIVKTTDAGDLFIQIKSSRMGAVNFLNGRQSRRAKYIGIVIVCEFYSLEFIYKAARKVISDLRIKKLNKDWGAKKT